MFVYLFIYLLLTGTMGYEAVPAQPEKEVGHLFTCLLLYLFVYLFTCLFTGTMGYEAVPAHPEN